MTVPMVFHGALAAVAILFAVPVDASPSTVAPAPITPGDAVAKPSLLADAAAIAPSIPFTLAVRLELPHGWHTYWRNPGESGAPSNVDWQLPADFSASPLAWPTPVRFTSGPVVGYGYENEVWFTATITPPPTLKPGATVSVGAVADWLACAEICVPEQATLTLELPVATSSRPVTSVSKQAFVAAEKRVPQEPPAPIKATGSDSEIVISLDGISGKGGPITGGWFFPTAFGVIDDAETQNVEPTPDGVRLTATRAGGSTSLPATIEGVLVVERGQERTGYRVQSPLVR